MSTKNLLYQEKSKIKIMLFLGGISHWTWYFFFEKYFPEVHDFLWTRVLVCALALTSAIILHFFKNIQSSMSRAISIFVVWTFLINEAWLLHQNFHLSLFFFTFFGVGLIASCSVFKFSDFLPFSIFTIITPFVFKYLLLKETDFPIFLWLAFLPVVFTFLGFLIYSNFSYQAAFVEANVQALQNSKMAALGEVAAGIAHEINNPLAIIRGKSDILLGKTFVRENSYLQGEIQKIRTTTVRVEKTINSLLMLSRNSTDELSKSVHANALIENSLQICKESFRNQSIEMNVQCPENLMILGREGELGQVLLNLLKNSFDALVKYSTKSIHIIATLEDNFVLIRVIDSGPPISNAIKNRLMEPFFTTKTDGNGTGLGLSISKSIMTSQEGELYFEEFNGQNSFVMKCRAAIS